MTEEPPDNRTAYDVVKQLTGAVPVDERRSDDVVFRIPWGDGVKVIHLPRKMVESMQDKNNLGGFNTLGELICSVQPVTGHRQL